MNLDDYTKELFGGLDGWFQRSGVYGKGSFQTMDRSSSIEFEQATQIAKEVQRREIKAKLDVMHWAMKGHSVDSEDYCKTMQREINQLEQQLKDLEEK